MSTNHAIVPRASRRDQKVAFFLAEPTQFKTDIYADPGKENKKMVKWYCLVQGDALNMPPWIIRQRRLMGRQYMNTHSRAVSEVFNSNTNI